MRELIGGLSVVACFLSLAGCYEPADSAAYADTGLEDSALRDSGATTDAAARDGALPDSVSEASDASVDGDGGVAKLIVSQMAVTSYFRSAAGATCARLSNGTVKCWGLNRDGELGDDTNTDRKVPGLVKDLGSVAEIAMGGGHACARIDDGTVRCWGANDKGQLGYSTSTLCSGTAGPSACSLHANAVPGLSGVVQLSLSYTHSCALLNDDTVKCWGGKSNGQLGYGSAGTESLTPTKVPGLTNVAAVTTGTAHTCVRLKDGSVRCWGWNVLGQLGDGTKTDRPFPGVGTISGGVAAVVASGANATCALMKDGTVSCWGNLDDGLPATTPKVITGLATVAGVSLNPERSFCAWLTDGTAKCWGQNNSGEIGDGTTTSRATPAPVAGLAGVVEIVMGETHTCARQSDGAVKCWGGNVSGQLGDGTTATRLSPTPVVW